MLTEIIYVNPFELLDIPQLFGSLPIIGHTSGHLKGLYMCDYKA